MTDSVLVKACEKYEICNKKNNNNISFDFIDGKIVSYDYHPILGRRSQNYGNIDYFDSLPEFRNVTIDLGKIYIIECTYRYIWNDRPEREGLY